MIYTIVLKIIILKFLVGDPEDTESNFNTHKLEVIKNSIKYNLNLAISSYCTMKYEFDNTKAISYDFTMPVLLDEEWDKILSNISIVSFMQGWDCGLKIYNNYEMVSSTNNELTVTPSEIYYVKKDEFNKGTGNYHRIDCDQWELSNEDNEFISFKSKEVKYDKIEDNSGNAQYDHKNLACYTCINTDNYESKFKPKTDDYWNNKKYTSYYDRIDSLYNTSQEISNNLKIAGYIGIAKERQNIYKTNALPVSEGYKVIYNNDNDSIKCTNNSSAADNLPEINLEKIKKLQITISNTKSKVSAGNKEPILKLNIKVGDDSLSNVSINLDQSKPQTVILNILDRSEDGKLSFEKIDGSLGYDVEYKIDSIKAIYK